MKKLNLIIAIITLTLNIALSASTCFAQKTEKRALANFHAISFGGSYNVYVKFGEVEDLVLEGASEDINRVETVVEKGVLKIRTKRGVKSWNSVGNKLSVTITAIKLDDFALSGAGILKVEGTLNAPLADFRVSGSGEIIADVDTENANVAISGSGSVKISGKTGASLIAVSGSGSVKAEGLLAETSEVKISGSGNVYINVKDELKATILGSGSIKYLGNPNISLNKLGSGTVSEIK